MPISLVLDSAEILTRQGITGEINFFFPHQNYMLLLIKANYMLIKTIGLNFT